MSQVYVLIFAVLTATCIAGGVMWCYAKLQLSHTVKQGKKVRYTFDLLEERWQSFADLGRIVMTVSGFVLIIGLVAYNLFYVSHVADQNAQLNERNQILVNQLIGPQEPMRIKLSEVCPK